MISIKTNVKMGAVLELDSDSFMYYYYESFFRERGISINKIIAIGSLDEKIEVMIEGRHYFIMKIALNIVKRKSKYNQFLK